METEEEHNKANLVANSLVSEMNERLGDQVIPHHLGERLDAILENQWLALKALRLILKGEQTVMSLETDLQDLEAQNATALATLSQGITDEAARVDASLASLVAALGDSVSQADKDALSASVASLNALAASVAAIDPSPLTPVTPVPAP